ncbi:CBS domain protein [compost metagenome]
MMTKDVVSIAELSSVDEAAEMMAASQIRRLPVTRDGKLIGIVSLGDLAVKDIFADEAAEALSDISQRQLH